MSARVVCCLSLIGLTAGPLALPPGSASADTIVIPGITTVDRTHPRAGYRQAAFPPPQYDLLRRRVPLALKARPTYRQADTNFPPPGGRFGGGFLEYVLTGGRPEPVSPDSDPSSEPVSPSPLANFFSPGPYAAPNPGPLSAIRSNLPVGGLPPALPAYGVEPQATAAPQAYAAPPPPVIYADPVALAAPRGDVRPGDRPLDPSFERQEVAYAGDERPGTIIIDTPGKHLFLVRPGGRALRYGIGVGRPGFEWAGVKRISRKAEWPGWTPPSEMLKRRPDLPRHMAGGEANPLGARALYLGSSMYRIHGTNEPGTIGTNVSSGCIRMMNADVIDLYGRVGVGTRVVVL